MSEVNIEKITKEQIRQKEKIVEIYLLGRKLQFDLTMDCVKKCCNIDIGELNDKEKVCLKTCNNRNLLFASLAYDSLNKVH